MSDPSLRAHLDHHLGTALASLARLRREPVASLMTLAVIVITLALPTGLHLVVNSAHSLGTQWDGATSLSAFLKPEVKEAEARQLLQRVEALPDVASAQLLTQQQALTEFSLFSGFDEALSLLEENPLPMVLLVRPDSGLVQPERAEALLTRLRAEKAVDQVVLDLEWVKRLAAITETARRAVLLLALLLGLAVLLIISNTIRLEIRNRQDEILIIKQVGGSDAFVRRPFLYMGFWLGLLGALGTWLLILLAGLWLEGPVTELVSLYQADYQLRLFDPQTLLLLLCGGPLLGLGGAWIATAHHLARDIGD